MLTMNGFNRITCLDYLVFDDLLTSLPWTQKLLISTINQYSYCIAEEDADFKEALHKSDVLLPDGIGVVLAAKFLNGKRIKKIAGADLHEFLLNKLQNEEGSCFYLGASDETLQKIKERVNKEYPKVRFGSYSPPFKQKFSEEDSKKMIDVVNGFNADVLFVGMTAPKQEKWSFTNRDAVNANTICSIGAVFDFYAGTVQRPSSIWINLGLEWLGRLIKEPRRMWRRYIYYGGVFSMDLLKRKLVGSN